MRHLTVAEQRQIASPLGGLGSSALVTQPVEGDAEDVVDLTGLAGLDLGDPADHVDDLAEVGVGSDDPGRKRCSVNCVGLPGITSTCTKL